MDFKVVWTCALVFLHGVLCVGSDVKSVSVKEGDSVTLHSDIKISKDDTIRWYFKNTRIAQIDLYFSQTCTDVQCNEGTERFRNRLNLDHQTGSLTIMDTKITDSGEYHLKISRRGGGGEEIFSVTVYHVFTADKSKLEKDPEDQTDTPNPGLFAGVVAGIIVGVILLLVCLAVGLYYKIRTPRRHEATTYTGVQISHNHEMH